MKLKLTAIALATVAIGAIAAPAMAIPVPTYGNRWSNPQYAMSHSDPCPTEDSSDCYWDAARRGNYAGVSYTVLADDTGGYKHKGKVIYWRYTR